MIHLGDFPASHTAVCIPFDSFAASTGAPSAASNFAAGDVQIYKDGGTTQRSSSAGITVSTSFDTQTGLQMIVIDLSDNTDAGFYAAGHEYQVAIADITIDSQTVRFWAATFSIERANGVLAKLISGVAKVDVTKWLTGTIPAPAVTGVPTIDLKYILGTALTETAGQIAAAFKKFFDKATPTGTINSLPDAVPGAAGGVFIAGANAATSIATALTANIIGNITGNLSGSIGSVAAAGIAAATFAANALDAVWSATTRLLTAGTNIALAKGVGVTGFNDIAAGAAMTLTSGERAAIANEVETQIIDETDSEKVLTAITDKIASVNPSLGGLTLAAIASQVRTELTTELARIDVAISTRLATAGYTSPLDAAAVRAALGMSSANLDTQIDALPTNGELATALAGADDATLAQIALVKAKTDMIPAAPAAVGDVPTANQNADALLDRTAGVETGLTPREWLRLGASVLFGKASGLATTTAIYRDFGDTKPRITATVDADGNRTAITRDAA